MQWPDDLASRRIVSVTSLGGTQRFFGEENSQTVGLPCNLFSLLVSHHEAWSTYKLVSNSRSGTESLGDLNAGQFSMSKFLYQHNETLLSDLDLLRCQKSAVSRDIHNTADRRLRCPFRTQAPIRRDCIEDFALSFFGYILPLHFCTLENRGRCKMLLGIYSGWSSWSSFGKVTAFGHRQQSRRIPPWLS